MVEEEYPIHPKLDELIQAFKEFQHLTFPRGMPQPASAWKELLQHITKYESHIIQLTSEYLCGNLIKADNLSVSNDLTQSLQGYKIRSSEDSDYLNALVEYKNKIENMAYLIQDCIQELGNPCQKFRAD